MYLLGPLHGTQQTPCGQVRRSEERWPLHHGQESWPPPVQSGAFIWRETEQQVTDRHQRDQGTAFPSPPLSPSRGNKMGHYSITWNSLWLYNQGSPNSNQGARDQGRLLSLFPRVIEVGMCGPRRDGPVPLQRPRDQGPEDEVFLWRWREDVVMSSPPPDLGPFNQAEECTYIAIKHLNFLNIKSFSKWN